ncbi:hypothetical protein DESC_90047 [Desulfosarcina cetonica]|nr:hypothetical protein DESC_90047 [Desulfosarcina cetonica]
MQVDKIVRILSHASAMRGFCKATPRRYPSLTRPVRSSSVDGIMVCGATNLERNRYG